MRFSPTSLPEVIHVEPDVHRARDEAEVRLPIRAQLLRCPASPGFPEVEDGGRRIQTGHAPVHQAAGRG